MPKRELELEVPMTTINITSTIDRSMITIHSTAANRYMLENDERYWEKGDD